MRHALAVLLVLAAVGCLSLVSWSENAKPIRIAKLQFVAVEENTDLPAVAAAIRARIEDYGFVGVDVAVVDRQVVLTHPDGFTPEMAGRLQDFARLPYQDFCIRVSFHRSPAQLEQFPDPVAEDAWQAPAPDGAEWIVLEDKVELVHKDLRLTREDLDFDTERGGVVRLSATAFKSREIKVSGGQPIALCHDGVLARFDARAQSRDLAAPFVWYWRAGADGGHELRALLRHPLPSPLVTRR